MGTLCFGPQGFWSWWISGGCENPNDPDDVQNAVAHTIHILNGLFKRVNNGICIVDVGLNAKEQKL